MEARDHPRHRVGRRRRRLVGDLIHRAAPERLGGGTCQPPASQRDTTGALRHRGLRRRPGGGPGRGGDRLHPGRPRPGRPLDAPAVRLARHRRFRALRHQGRAAAILRGRRRTTSWWPCWRHWRRAATPRPTRSLRPSAATTSTPTPPIPGRADSGPGEQSAPRVSQPAAEPAGDRAHDRPGLLTDRRLLPNYPLVTLIGTDTVLLSGKPSKLAVMLTLAVFLPTWEATNHPDNLGGVKTSFT